jgi:uncharacterized protein
MNGLEFTFCGAALLALPSGALWWPDERLLCVSDLHLGKSDRVARRLGLMLPPYESAATLDRLSGDLDQTGARAVICLGDSFDDDAAVAALADADRGRLLALMAGRDWTWVLGNHDPGPVDLGGAHRAMVRCGPLTFRHQAESGAVGEVSGHYHPKLALPGAGGARRCFVHDDRRLILPAYGAYTGGLSARDPAVRGLFGDPAFALLLGARVLRAPLARG